MCSLQYTTRVLTPLSLLFAELAVPSGPEAKKIKAGTTAAREQAKKVPLTRTAGDEVKDSRERTLQSAANKTEKVSPAVRRKHILCFLCSCLWQLHVFVVAHVSDSNVLLRK